MWLIKSKADVINETSSIETKGYIINDILSSEDSNVYVMNAMLSSVDSNVYVINKILLSAANEVFVLKNVAYWETSNKCPNCLYTYTVALACLTTILNP